MDKIEWSKEERELFQNALRELKKQVDECLTRDIKIRFDKISSKGTTSQNIKNLLDFLNGNYTYSIGIGNVGGFLNPDSWIAFVRKDIVRAGFINTEKFSVRNGVYLFIAYQGYFDSNPHFVLKFGFPNDGGIEVARCRAVNVMEQSGALERYSYTYPVDSLDYEKIINDFLEAMNYFNTFSPNDFIAINPQISGNDISQPQAQQIESISLNQILYGPPGTGKTYHTIDKALEILGYVEWNESEKKFELNEKALEKLKDLPFDTGTMSERDKKKALFDKFMEQGQIGFVTFHQSYGYEDFVEGIKPRLSGENDESQVSEKMEYEIKDGIFKEMCKNAQSFIKQIENKGIDIEITDTTKVWKMSLGDKGVGEAEPLQQYCFKNNEIRIGFDDKELHEQRSVKNFYKMKPNDIVCVLHSNKEISLIGIVLDKVEKDEGVLLPNWNTKYFKRFRKVKWLNTLDDKFDIYALNENTKLTQQTTYELTRIKPEQILKYIKEYLKFTTIEDNTQKPFILIIDEINRGNISKILGELITLLEPSKRKGEKEALEVKLPYSKEPFSVPNNLYIIGTMNTADRSIALLDTALRRRFEFIEMIPDFSKLSADCDGVDLQKLLKVMNNRIEFLLDRERTIGHAFFIDVKNLSDLKAVFNNKILPLLQEYFYDDYAKINAVLNDNGMLESKTMRDMEISLSDDFVDTDKRVWKITDSSQWKRWNFQKIYDNNAKKNPSPDNTESS